MQRGQPLLEWAELHVEGLVHLREALLPLRQRLLALAVALAQLDVVEAHQRSV
ncbi:hypothetical protein HYZ80_02900, partial [Candidatus Parcubacteria bacterium]|nr:hypothetical protein [Candidatus Parcubacteria bacterium]